MTRALRRPFAMFCLVALLAACSNESDKDASTTVAQSLLGRFGPKTATPVVADADLRVALKAAGTPILRLESEATSGFIFLAPLGVNQGITTWSSTEFQTVSMRDGVLLATRGFGPDIMTATAPSAAQLARGAGSHQRTYVYLDGGDQTDRVEMTCSVTDAGAETITVVGLGYPTRHIVETCTGAKGTDRNDYWFQGGAILQSRQFLVPGIPGMKLQAVAN